MRHATPAYDEGPHLRYGLQMLGGNSDRFDDSKMPITVLNAIPFKKTRSLFDAHIPSVLFSVLGAVAIFLWGTELYGVGAGLFAMSLYVFEPNILAHSQFVGTDSYSWTSSVIAMYFFWRFMKFGGKGRGLLAAATLGFSQLTKYSCVYLIPLFLVMAIVKCAAEKKPRRSIVPFFSWSAVFLGAIIFFINAGFFFNKTLMPLKEYEFKSHAMQVVQQKLKPVENLRVPLPYPYVQGIDLLREVEETGGGNGRNYLFGQMKEKGKGFDGYYLIAWLYKIPLAFHIFFLWTLVLLARKRNRPEFFQNEWFLLAPFVFFSVYFNFLMKAQIGIRYSMVAFMSVYVLCGLVWKCTDNRAKKMLVGMLLFWQVASVYSYFPHFLSYFNELVPDRKQAYKILADSNLDWGHNVYYLKEYVKRHPDSRPAPSEPRPGRLIVTANDLVGINNPDEYRWLRENFEPDDHIAYSYLVYDITPTEALVVMQKMRIKAESS